MSATVTMVGVLSAAAAMAVELNGSLRRLLLATVLATIGFHLTLDGLGLWLAGL